MPFKTPGTNSIYIRSILPPEKDEKLNQITDYADKNTVPVLLP